MAVQLSCVLGRQNSNAVRRPYMRSKFADSSNHDFRPVITPHLAIPSHIYQGVSQV